MGAGQGQALSTLITPAAPGPEQQDAPLTEAERKLLVRLFSDPTYFPVEFRTWIRTYIESSDIRLPSSAIVGGNAPRVNLPAGVILPYAGSAIPSNCIICDGRELDRTDYALLFEAIGLIWGTPSGGSVFKIPDLRDRALYGAGNIVGLATTDGRALGARGGPRHHHYINQSVSGSTDGVGDHGHAVYYANDAAPGSGRNSVTGPSGTYTTSGGAGSHSHGLSGNVSGDTTGGYAQDQPSWAGINYIIATGKNV